MSRFKPWLDLCRVSNLPSVWSNVLTACLLATGSLAGAPLLALALSAFYLAGMAFNDVCDVEIDRKQRPTRPIPSGRVSLAGARRLTAALFALGFALLAAAPHWQGLAGGVLLLLAIVVYDLDHKGRPASVLVMAACRLLVYGVVALASTAAVNAWVWLAGFVQFAYVVVISLVARHENSRSSPYAWPVIPLMLAGIALLDGVLLALLVAPPWLAAGVALALLTRAGQRYVRGD